MFKYYDRIRETSTSVGLGNFTLSAYSSSYLRFSNVFITNYRFPYCIAATSSFEVGIGYLNGSGELVRETLLSSSDYTNTLGTVTFNSISFTAGSKDVFVPSPASLNPTLSSSPSGSALQPQFLVYALNTAQNGYEWQMMPLNGTSGSGGIRPFPNFSDKRILFTDNNGQITVNNNLQFDPSGATSIMTLAGDLYVSGNIRGSTKLFSIPHPIIPGKILNHGSLEGPELGIYFRKNFTIYHKFKLELPDYFIKLSEDLSVFINCKDGSKCSWVRNNDHIEVIRKGLHVSSTDASIFIIGSRNDVGFVLNE